MVNTKLIIINTIFKGYEFSSCLLYFLDFSFNKLIAFENSMYYYQFCATGIILHITYYKEFYFSKKYFVLKTFFNYDLEQCTLLCIGQAMCAHGNHKIYQTNGFLLTFRTTNWDLIYVCNQYKY